LDLREIGFSLFSFDFCRIGKNSKENRLKPVLLKVNSTAAWWACSPRLLRYKYLSQIIQWRKTMSSRGSWPRTRTSRSGLWRQRLPKEWRRWLAPRECHWRPRQFALKACNWTQLPRMCREQTLARGHSFRPSLDWSRQTGMPRSVHRDSVARYSH